MRIIILLIIIALTACRSYQPLQKESLPEIQLTNISADTLTRDTLIKFAARPDLNFNFDYLVYLPKGMRLNNLTYLLVETTNTGPNDSMEHHEKGARYAAARSSVGNFVAKKLKLPLLVPVFPRSATNWMYYTHALDRETLLSKEFGIERLDLQLLSMIDDAKRNLAQHKLPLQDKFFITGFSASGTFANRFCLLHPEKVKATASGGINAIAILPVTQIGGKTLNYPLGFADVEIITNNKVRLEEFKSLPQLLYMGEKDENDAVAFDDAYSKEDRELVYEIMGKQLVPQRWKFIQTIYQQNNVQAEFRTYKNIGHGTDLKINYDLVDFFRQHLN